ncbi:hypothetical protein NECAME_06923 [Necator americanus]|uniref:Uncharacterized protein n=1 Tax=Necator americanus TaxID=51031 RepID=W2TQG3_NECAM|nr:hypothetical protein NECAME_06923 [Necator americanus]ETN84290.1 hypothetical protein NECAME_06923 [Necator americanus]
MQLLVAVYRVDLSLDSKQLKITLKFASNRFTPSLTAHARHDVQKFTEATLPALQSDIPNSSARKGAVSGFPLKTPPP